MTGKEIENFYDYDNHEYKLKENQIFLEIYEKTDKVISVNNLQFLMEEIVQFFEFKYPDVMFESTTNATSKEYKDMLSISKYMGIDQLKFRIHQDANIFLECGYWRFFELSKKVEVYPYKRTYRVYIEENGELSINDLENLKREKIILSIHKIKTPEELYEKLHASSEDIDYSQLELVLERRKNAILLRKKFLELTALKILYSRNTLPIYSYSRVKFFIELINKEYNIDLSTNPIDDIMNIDYKTVIYSQLLKK